MNFSNSFEITWNIMSSTSPWLCVNNMDYDLYELISTLVIKNSSSHKKFYSEALGTQEILYCLKEDVGPHQL